MPELSYISCEEHAAAYHRRCMITKTAILPGDLVVKGWSVSGLSFDDCYELGHQLQFGLPLYATYDEESNPCKGSEQQAMMVRAWKQQSWVRPFSDDPDVWMLAHPQALRSVIQRVTRVRADEVVLALLQWQHGTSLLGTEATLYQVLESVVDDPECRVHLWNELKNGIFTEAVETSGHTWMVHASVFQEMVRMHSDRARFENALQHYLLLEEPEFPIPLDIDPTAKAYVDARMDEWKQQQWDKMIQDHCSELRAPTALPGYLSHHVLSDYYWGGVSDQEILDTLGSTHVVDCLLFMEMLPSLQTRLYVDEQWYPSASDDTMLALVEKAARRAEAFGHFVSSTRCSPGGELLIS